MGRAVGCSVAFFLLLLAGCYSGGMPLTGFAESDGEGPVVVWDIFDEPLPDIPFPNDIATRPDRTAGTGRRVNASLHATTSFERKLRVNMAKLDGFGTYNPIWIRFESPDPDRPELGRLDVEQLRRVQTADTHFNDDAILLINVTPSSRTYGEATLLDFGNGNFPITIEREDRYFENDPRICASNLLYDTYEEDTDGDGNFDVWEDINQNGELDAGEDVDGDGTLDVNEDTDDDGTFDHPNLWGAVRGDLDDYDPCAADDNRDYNDLISFYELSTNTLVFRPIFPLEERTTYAVVITRDLVGIDGNSIRSPFPYVHHLQQTEALRPLFEDGLLQQFGRSADDVAFAWTYTTQSVTEGLVKIREGLHGYGPLADLHDLYPPNIDDVLPVSEAPGIEAYLMRPNDLTKIIELVADKVDFGFSTDDIQPLLDTYGAVDYLVAGEYTSPDFIDAGGGSFDIDYYTGKATHSPLGIRFLLVVPKKQYGTAPFPVALYCHGYTSMKIEPLAFAGILAKFGIATFGIDAYSHGIPLGGEFDAIISELLVQLGGAGLTPFWDAIKKDRARDLNNDGLTEPGGDFWTNDMFHTRDSVRQTAVDYLQAIRVLQAFNGERLWAKDHNADGIANDLAGDFNADGVVDVGGPNSPYYILGTSMGGINSTIIGGLDPAISAAAPISAGGGLLEVGLRTDLSNVNQAVILPMLGPMVLTRPSLADSRLAVVEWLVNDVFAKQKVPFALVGKLEPTGPTCSDESPCAGNNERCSAGRCTRVVDELRRGDILEVENQKNGKIDRVVIGEGLTSRSHISADRGDPIAVRIWRPDGTLLKEIDTFEKEVESFQGQSFAVGEKLVAIQEGLGYRRNTPNLRRLIGLAQTILEPADPVNYAVKYNDPLFVRPEGASPTNLLAILTLGDMTVPISTGVALGRAAGVIEFKVPDPVYGKTHNQLLIDNHVVEAVEKLHYFANDPCHYHPSDVNFDIDDLSNGLHEADLPRLNHIVRPPACAEADPPPQCEVECTPMPPLRASAQNEHGVRAVRFPALNPRGQHAVDLPRPDSSFDTSTFTINQIGLFLRSGGTILSDHPCLEANDCSTCAGERDCPPLPPPSYLDINGTGSGE
ncbi:MAG: hypothetical protein A2341_00265 [Deltaproteobacteria bacterium RIFOXYB12_FULL_58_9]|nr:MAG: hypothetical protein A2341_00265 [Deltaproteobacteria bacterium RIFOXYB12_FULL_58_9]